MSRQLAAVGNQRKRWPRQLPPEREQELLLAARDAFFDYGLGGVSMDIIARRAEVSKATLYRRYSSKFALFEAVTEDFCRNKAGATESVVLNPEAPEASLLEFARTLRRFAQNSIQIEMIRLWISEARRNPELILWARTMSIGPTIKQLQPFFEILIERRQMEHAYPEQAARSFILLFSGGVRPLYGVPETAAEIERTLQADMKMFITGCRIRSPNT